MPLGTHQGSSGSLNEGTSVDSTATDEVGRSGRFSIAYIPANMP